MTKDGGFTEKKDCLTPIQQTLEQGKRLNWKAQTGANSFFFYALLLFALMHVLAIPVVMNSTVFENVPMLRWVALALDLLCTGVCALTAERIMRFEDAVRHELRMRGFRD